MKSVSFEGAAPLLKNGEIGVIPTDTVYGLVASAFDEAAVERIYCVRGRDGGKPCIVLIADIADIWRFGIVLSDFEPQAVERFWPGKVSVILPCPDRKWRHLHRGTGTIAFRLPDDDTLRDFLRKTGPLVAPSANRQGMKPAETIGEAMEYFGDTVDFFVDGGLVSGPPSTVIRFEGGEPVVVRPGAVII